MCKFYSMLSSDIALFEMVFVIAIRISDAFGGSILSEFFISVLPYWLPPILFLSVSISLFFSLILNSFFQ